MAVVHSVGLQEVRMPMHNYINPDMQELIDALSKCIVPNHKAVWRVNSHVPYYSRGRYKRVA